MATTASTQSTGSPIATEVVDLLDKYFLDRTFGGVDIKKVKAQLEKAGPLTEEQALEASTKVVKSLGDRYSRVLSPSKATKLGKYDVTGVGMNLVISDDGTVKVGAVPPEGSDALQLGIGFGDTRWLAAMSSWRGFEKLVHVFDDDHVRVEQYDTLELDLLPHP